VSSTEPGVPRTAHSLAPDSFVRDRDSLHSALRRVEREGWEGPTARFLLDYVRDTVVRPLVVELGVRGAAASQAEATAWQDVWMALASPTLRDAVSPWGVLWEAARRAILGEIVSARYATSVSRAWRLSQPGRRPAVRPPTSLATLTELGWEPVAPPIGSIADRQPMDVVNAACDVLVSAGWAAEDAIRIVAYVMTDEPTTRGSRWTNELQAWTTFGWRNMATRLGLPPWQARRLVMVLRGTVDHPGLLPRLIRAGGRIDLDSDLRAAVASTRDRTRRSPVLKSMQ
jgi:hypothetical protein